MRYTRTRDFLSRDMREMRSRDRRNPYGSRGGYIMNDRRGHDYAYDRMGDMARDGQYSDAQGYRNYGRSIYPTGLSSNQYARQLDRNSDYYGDMTRRVGYFDYNTYDQAYDMRDGRDMDHNFKLTPTEIRKWDKELKRTIRNGGMSVDQIQQMAQQLGIRFEEFTPELLTVTANMIESDYGETLKGDPMLYVKLAKDFLCDEDFDGTPEEKAYLYYTAIANKEDD